MAAPARRTGYSPAMFKEYANPAQFAGSELTITEYPNPILRARNEEITVFDEKLKELGKEFMAIMYAANGVGIAAPQLGLNIQLFVYNPDPTLPKPVRAMSEHVVINPKVLEWGEKTDVECEGCLSSRSECCVGDVRRAKEILVEYQGTDGKAIQRRLRGFEARVFQHEFDHLQGVLHIDRQTAQDRAKIQPYLDKLVELHGEGGWLEPRPEAAAAMQPALRTKKSAASKAAKAEEPTDPAPEKRGFGGAPKKAAPKKRKKR